MGGQSKLKESQRIDIIRTVIPFAVGYSPKDTLEESRAHK